MEKTTNPLYLRLTIISLISLLYNVIWLFVFIILLFFFPYWLEMIWLIFLLTYLLFAQPLKDTFIFSITKKFLGKTELKNYKILNQLNKAEKLRKSIALLKGILRSWDLASVSIHLRHPRPHVIKISKSLKASISYKDKTIVFEELLTYLEAYMSGHNLSDIPSNIQKYLRRKKIFCVIPIVFREFLLGFLSFQKQLSKEAIEIFEYAAQKIAILSQNKILSDKIDISKSSERDFSIARKIELFLELQKDIELKHFALEKILKGWKEKYFPLYYDAKTIVRTMPQKRSVTYIILCRPEKGFQRGTILNLCSVQGYFISFCDASSSLLSLSKKLHKIIQTGLESSIRLDGFLMRIEDKNILCCPFGKGLVLKEDGDIIKIKNSAPLGSKQRQQFNVIRMHFKKDISFLINDYRLLSIRHKKIPA